MLGLLPSRRGLALPVAMGPNGAGKGNIAGLAGEAFAHRAVARGHDFTDPLAAGGGLG